MPGDRLLGTLLRALQSQDPQDTPRLLGTVASLLTTLNNPLNVTLLVSQTLTAHALWIRSDGLRFTSSFMGVFHSAVKRIIQQDIEEADRKANNKRSYDLPSEPRIPLQQWAKAVLEGLDHRSPGSRHALAIGGMLLGISATVMSPASSTVLSTLQQAFVKATNAALHSQGEDDLNRLSVALAVNHAFPLLSDFERSQLDYDELLPILLPALLRSTSGLGSVTFLGVIGGDLRHTPDHRLDWPAASLSYQSVKAVLSEPLVASMGPMSRLIAHAIEHARDPWLVSAAVDDIAEFSGTLYKQWRSSPLADIDAPDETSHFSDETLQRTLPDLWRLLRSTLFATVIILRSATGRLLADSTLGNDVLAPQIASQSLNTLHHLNFIFARLSSAAFSQYTFVHLTCIDILNAYPLGASTFLRSIAPSQLGSIPPHPTDRISDLFFLNTAEHFTLITSPSEAASLFIPAASPYLTAIPTPSLSPSFEAAHSLMLATFSAQQNADLAATHLPFYVNALFTGFPQNLSARQFRLAFKNLVKLVSPPGKIAVQQPMLAAVLLDLVRERAVHAPTVPLPVSAAEQAEAQGTAQGPVMSEQAVLVLTLVDALPFIDIRLLEEWLPLLPELMGMVRDERMREECIKHLWEIMISGVMDAERSQVCVGWWTTRGGMETVLYGSRDEVPMMAGALPPTPASKM